MIGMIEGMKNIYIFFKQHHFRVQNSFHSPSIPFMPSEHNLSEAEALLGVKFLSFCLVRLFGMASCSLSILSTSFYNSYIRVVLVLECIAEEGVECNIDNFKS